jgi:hypothetical protein
MMMTATRAMNVIVRMMQFAGSVRRFDINF